MAAFTPITSLDIAANPGVLTDALSATPGISFDTGSLSVVQGANSIGIYDGSLAALGIGSGLILTSGLMPGITNTSTSYGISNGMVGDADLNAVVNTVFHTISYDATTLSVNFTVTDPNIKSISFNLVVGSDEYPEWVNQFVDIGVVLVNGVNVAYFNGDTTAPLSVIGSNLANGYFKNNATGILPIEYDGVSAPLTVFAPVRQGLNTLKIGVSDTGDHILDTGLIIANMAGSNSPVYGVVLDLDGSDLNDTLHGGNVGENIHGLGGDDSCYGGSGDDVISGDDGNDSLSGDSGNDYLDGGAGLDTAMYAGAMANYQVVAYTDGTVKVLDLVGVGPAGDGLDVLTGVETLVFADAVIDVSTLEQIAPPPTGGAIAPPVLNGPALLTVTEDAAVAGINMSGLLAGAVAAGPGDIISITGVSAPLPAGVTFSTVSGGFLAPPVSTLSIDPANAAYQSLAAGESSEVSVAYNVTNSAGSTPNTAIFTVVGVNDAPIVTAPAAASGVEGDALLSLNLLANASDIDNGALLSIVEIPLPPVVVTPPPVQNGNGNHGGDQNDTPPPPVLDYSAIVSGAYTLSTLPAGVVFDPLTQTVTVDPTHANFERLSAGQVAQLTLHYGVSDGTVVVNTSAVIRVTGTNDLPVVNGTLAFAVTEDTLLAINPRANVSDPDIFDTFTINPGVLPAGVSLTSFNAGNAAYQSLAAGETTSVTWDYTVSDGHVTVANSATFTVTGSNDAPIIATPAAATMAEDGGPVSVSAIAGATDVDHGAVLSVVNVPLVLPAGITYDALTESFTIDPTNAIFQELSAGESRVYSVNYGISDGVATTATSVRFTVIGTNDAPIVTGPTTGSPNEDGNVVSVNATGNATDVDDHQGLQVTGVPDILPAGITYDAASQRFDLDPTDPAFQYLSKGEVATISINYNVFDGHVEIPTSVIFSITGDNDAPFVTGVVELGAISENAGPLTLNLLANAVDVDHLDTLNIRSNQGFEPVVSVSGATWNPAIAYTLAGNQINLNTTQFNSLRAGENLDISFSYLITDGINTDGDAVGTTHLTIVGANDAPSAMALSSSSVTENAVAGTTVGTFSATDGDRNESLSYQLLDDPSGYFAISGNRLVVAAGAAVDYEAASSRNIQVQVTDADGASFVRSFSIAINNIAGVDIIASNKADVISPTSGDAKLRSTNEEDTIDGKGDNDNINAGGGNDSVLGDDGNDQITGGGGNDAINGGAGTDTAVFSGNWADYNISVAGAVTTVSDRRAGNPDGTDTLQSIESFRFANGTFSPAAVLNSGPTAVADVGSSLLESNGIAPGIRTSSGNVVSNDTDPNLATAGLGELLGVGGIRSGALADGGALTTVSGTTLVSGIYGNLSIGANGSYTYSVDNARAVTNALVAGETATETFTYQLVDAHGAASLAQLSFSIAGADEIPNNAPSGSPSASLAAGTEDQPYSVSTAELVAGFSDFEGHTLAVANLSASNGSVVANADGSFSITPTANFNGTMLLSYQVVDGYDGSTAATQSYTVAAVNDAPLGNTTGTLAAGSEDTSYTVTSAELLAGFSDPEGDAISLGSLTASNGSIVDNGDGSFIITPSADFNGNVTLAYSVIDANGAATAVSRSYNLAALNDPISGAPSAVLAAGSEDSAYTVSAANLLAGFSDVDGDTLSVTGLTASNGSVVANANGSFTITPGANFNGSVTLSYTVIDGHGSSVAATQSYTLAAVNDAPLGNNNADLATGSEDNAYTLTAAELLSGFSDIDGGTLGVSNLVASNGTVVANADGSFTITPSANFSGKVNVDYLVTDGQGGSRAGALSYDLAAVNDPVTGSATAALIAGTGNTPYTISAADLLAGFSDADGDALGVANLVASDGSVVANADGSYTITPSLNFSGVVSLAYEVIDGQGSSLAAALSYNVTLVNTAPTGTATAVLAGGTEDATYNVSAADLLAGFADAEGDALSIANLTASNGSVVANADGSYSITPVANFNGAVSLAYEVSDGRGGSIATTQSYSLAAQNDAPTGSATAVLAATAEDSATTVSAAELLAGFSDLDGDTLSVVNLGSSSGSAVANADGSFTLTPAADFNGTLTLNYTVSDGQGGSLAASRSLGVTAVNDGPVGTATATLAGGSEDTPVTISAAQLLAGFSDVDGDSLAVANLTASNGSVVANANGSYTITPDADYNGPVSLAYEVIDGNGGSIAATQGYLLAAVNDAPTGSATAALAAGSEDSAVTLTRAQLLAGFTDRDGDSLGVANLTTSSGSVVANADGSFTLLPGANFNGTLNLGYQVVDGQGGSIAASQSLAIAAVNDAPGGSASTVLLSGAQNQPYSVSASQLLAGFSDVDGDLLSIANLTASDGSVSANADGSFTITPSAGFSGSVTLNYSVVDPQGLGVAATQSYELLANPVLAGDDSLLLTRGLSSALAAEVLLANDSGGPGDALSVTAVSNAVGASVSLVDGKLLINSAAAGGSFDYTVSAASGASTLGHVSFSTAVTGTLADILAAGAVSAADLQGQAGNDNLGGSAGADRLLGDAGNDTLNGLDGADLLIGGADLDLLDGGLGADTLDGGLGNDTYVVDNAGDLVIEAAAAGTDLVRSTLNTYTLTANVENLSFTGSGDAQLSGNALNNALTGGAGNDRLDGGAGNDALNGGLGNDSYVIDSSLDVITDAGGIDSVETSLASYTLGSVLENLSYVGSGNFSGTGNLLANILSGGAGNDTLNGGTGADTLIGGSGDDRYLIDNALDVLLENPGAGIDTVASAISHSLGNDFENLTLTGSATINGTGNSLDNVLLGNTGANTLDGGAGNDSLAGGTGNDTYIVDSLGDVVSEAAAAGTDSIRTALNIYSLAANVEILTFTGSGDAQLTGTSLNDTLNGGAGNDTLDGGSGNDRLNGGLGDDLYLVDSTLDVISDTGGIDSVQTTAASYTLATGVDNLSYAGAGNFSGIGNTGVNTLVGGLGNDTLNGSSGADRLVGGGGDDRYIVDNVLDVVVENDAEGLDTIASAVSYSLAGSVENLVLTGTGSINGSGNALDNVLTGNTGGNTLDGGAGNDSLAGGTGNDSYVVDSLGDIVTEAAAAGTDTVRSLLNSYALGSNLENLVFIGSGDAVLNGNTLNNVLTAGAGNDTLDGGTGNDTLNGGLGNDSFIVDSTLDLVADTGGIDTVLASAAAYTLGTNIENLSYTGAGNFSGTGNSAANTLVGGLGNDTLNGGSGNDRLVGSAGDDRYVVDSTLDLVIENDGEGNDTVASSVSLGLAAFVENLVLTGTGSINGSGNGLDNNLTGNAGANTLDGGAGADTLAGAAGNDTYIVDSAADVVSEAALGGTDTVRTTLGNYALAAEVENLVFTGAGAALLVGNGLANVITGAAGDDTLDGGLGNDTLNGGLGNDLFIVDSSLDVVADTGGIDTVQTSLGSYTLGSVVENLAYTGIGNFSGTGNLLANLLSGGAGNDTLNGAAGIDTLLGGDGDDLFLVSGSEAALDRMDAGAGADTLVAGGLTALTLNGFDTAGNGIEVFQGNGLGINGSSGNDVFNFSGLTAITGSGIGFIDAGAGNDSITGSNFADVLRGNAGDDRLTGGAGDDQLSGGLGADSFVFDAGFGADTITDFLAGAAAGHDVIDLDDALFADFAAVQAAMTQVGSNVVISAGAEGSLTIANTTVAALVSADFAFH